MTIGEELRAIRHKLGWSLQTVEEKSAGRFMAVAVGSWERDQRHTSVDRTRELLAFYGGYRLEVLGPGDVIYRGGFGGEQTVKYWAYIPGITSIECGSRAEAAALAEAVFGGRVGQQLVGPVKYGEDQ